MSTTLYGLPFWHDPSAGTDRVHWYGQKHHRRHVPRRGFPVWDADAAVHRLYDVGGGAVGPIDEVFPAAVINGAVSRLVLKDALQADPENLLKLEAIVHPLIKADREAFIAAQTSPLIVLDIPLLFETGADEWLDSVLVVSAPPMCRRRAFGAARHDAGHL